MAGSVENRGDEVINDSTRFSDLNGTEQERILDQKNIIFQGNETNLKELLAPLEKLDLDDIIDSNLLMKLHKNEKVTVGRRVRPLDETIENCYIPRMIRTLDLFLISEILPEKVLSQLDRFDHNEVVVLGGAAGTGRSTLLTNLANFIKKQHPNLWVMKIDLGNYLKSFREFKENNLKFVTLEDLLNSKLKRKSEKDFEKKIFSLSQKVIIILDGIDDVCLDYKDILLSVIRSCFRSSTCFLILAASMNVHQELGRELSHTLEPFTEKEQVDLLTKYWQQKFQLNHSRQEKCRVYVETVIEEKWLQSRGIGKVVGIPLVIRMIAEILERAENFDDGGSEWEGCYNFLSSGNLKPLLPKKLTLVELYLLYIHKNCSGGKKNSLNSLRDGIAKINMEYNGYFHILALETVLSKRMCEYFNCYKTVPEEIPEDKLLAFSILKNVGHSLQFTHRTFAEYFLAECILIELCEYKKERFLKFFFEEVLVIDRFKVVRLFIDNFIQTDLNFLQKDSLKIIGRRLKQADSSLLLYTSAKEGSLEILKFLFKCFEIADIPVDINSVRIKGDLPLHSAVEADYLQVVEFLITNGVDVHTRNKNDCTALHLAAKAGSLDLVKLLVKHGIEVNCKDGKGRTALHIAAKKGCLEMVKYLLAQGADVNSRRRNGGTALHVAAGLGDLGKVKYLVENGAYINYRGEEIGMTICNAVVSGDLNVVRYLVEKGADVTVRSNRGGTMLHVLPKWNANASLRKIIELTKFLIDKGVDINGVDNSGDTALHIAIERQYEVGFITFLVEQGANVHFINHFGDTPLTTAISRGDLNIVEYLMDNGAEFNAYHNQNEVLHNAVGENRLDLVKLLGERGVSLDVVKNSGLSTLDRAVCNNNLDMVKYLVERGVKINNISVIKEALRSCNLEMVIFLVESGAETHVDFGEVTSNGDLGSIKFLLKRGSTFKFFEDVGGNLELLQFLFDRGIEVDKAKIFFKAICEGDLTIIKYLTENGFDVNARDVNGSTALHEASKHNHVYVLNYLLEHGADVNIRDRCNRTPLIVAAGQDCIRAVELLVGKGADVCSVSNEKETALSEAVRENHIDTVKFLVDNGAQFNVKSNEFGTPLCLAFIRGNLETAEYLAEKDPDLKCNVEELVKRVITDSEPEEDSQLVDAIFSNYFAGLETVRYLIEKGVEINSREINEYKLLIDAVEEGDLRLVKYLIGRGGDVNKRDFYSHTALHETTDLNMAALLVQHGADVNAKTEDGCSVLRSAMENSNLDMCKFLIKCGADINEEDEDGVTLLHMKMYSFKSISSDKFKYLLEMGAKLQETKDGRSVLHIMASTYNDLDVIDYVIKAGVDINSRDKKGHTPLDEAVTAGDLELVKLLIENGADLENKNSAETRGILFRAIESNNYGGKSDLDMVKFLVQKGAKVNAKEESGRTLLHEAVSERNLDIVKFLVDNGAEVNAVDKNGNSVLHEASRKGDYFLVKYLVEKGASLDAKTDKGHTVLHEAAASGCFAAVKFFVENGVDVNVSDKEGRTALHEVAARKRNRFFNTNESFITMKFLIENGATVDEKSRNGRTPLYEAAEYRDLHQVKILAANGADVNIKEEYGRTPIFAAVMSSTEKRFTGASDRNLIDFLVESGANLAHKADNGRTVLHEASILGNLDLVERLVEMGVDVNAKTGGGRTPLHDAGRRGMLDVVKFLVKNGAKVDVRTTEGHTALDEATKGEHAEVVQFFEKTKTEIESKMGDGGQQ